MALSPLEIKREKSGVTIKWSDGQVSAIANEKLRKNCPCAGCRQARGDTSHETPLTSGNKPVKKSLNIVPSSISEELELVRIWPIGNYALGAEWGDGHSTGIYTYRYLAELGTTTQ